MSLLALALLAAPATPQSCNFDSRVVITGVVATVNQAPTAPFESVAVGNALDMTLSFASDVLCQPPSGVGGYLATPECCELTVGGASALLDPTLLEPCLWGESYVLSPVFYVDGVSADAPFGTGDVRAVLDISDPQGNVGIGLGDLINAPLVVGAVTDPGFSISLTLVDGTGSLLAVIDVIELSGFPGSQVFGVNYCTAVPNSTGSSASMGTTGTPYIANNDFALRASGLPTGSFGYFLVSLEQAYITGVPNSVGALCLGGAIGRFLGPGQIQFSGNDTFVELEVDLNAIPLPTGIINVQPSDTWNFSYWHRDFDTVITSNFADGITVTFI